MKGAKRVRPSVRGGAARRPFKGYVIELTGALDRHEAEALQLEIRALAKRHRLVIDAITTRRPVIDGSA